MKSVFVNSWKRFWREESAQGTTEYVLLLVGLVALVLLVQGQVRPAVEEQIQRLRGLMSQVGQ